MQRFSIRADILAVLLDAKTWWQAEETLKMHGSHWKLDWSCSRVCHSPRFTVQFPERMQDFQTGFTQRRKELAAKGDVDLLKLQDDFLKVLKACEPCRNYCFPRVLVVELLPVLLLPLTSVASELESHCFTVYSVENENSASVLSSEIVEHGEQTSFPAVQQPKEISMTASAKLAVLSGFLFCPCLFRIYHLRVSDFPTLPCVHDMTLVLLLSWF